MRRISFQLLTHSLIIDPILFSRTGAGMSRSSSSSSSSFSGTIATSHAETQSNGKYTISQSTFVSPGHSGIASASASSPGQVTTTADDSSSTDSASQSED
jgi:hypothetical protein